MQSSNTPISGWPSNVAGAARVAGFFVLIAAMVPVHLLLKYVFRVDPCLVPLHFHKLLTRLIGFRLRRGGVMTRARPTLFIANHSSYLDIPVLGATIPAAFVAKAEVASWPLLGTLAKLQNTVFIERRATRAAEHRDGMGQRLQQGQSLILFPEGTSSDGQRTLPFKTSLFSLAETKLANGTYVTVQPVSILCTEIGNLPIGRLWRPYYAWYGDMTLLRHLWNVFRIGHFTVDVIFHPPVTIQDFPNRKALAAHCQDQIAKGVEQGVKGRLVKQQAGRVPQT